MTATFPIMDPFHYRQARRNDPTLPAPIVSIPLAMIVPHERQARRNHNQTLDRLAPRGGLSALEAVFVLADADWRPTGLTEAEASTVLKRLVTAWEAAK